MARRSTLVKLLDDLRAETRQSLNPAHNAQARATQVKILQRTQERLWDDFDWPHLRIDRSVPIQVGQRYYDLPEELSIDRLEMIEIFRDGAWFPLLPGIDGCHYSTWNSDLDERSYPPRRWKIHEDEDVEIWPISDTAADDATRDGYIRYTGIRNLNALVADDDRADLDDRLLVLFAAAEILAASGAKDAQLKLDLANRIYAQKRSDLTPSRTVRMFGVGEPKVSRRFVRYRPPGA